MKMLDNVSSFPPPYKMRKKSNGMGAISITPTLLDDLFLQYYRKRKAAERDLKLDQENISPPSSLPQEYNQVKSSTKLVNADKNDKSDGKCSRKTVKAKTRKNKKEVLRESVEPNIPEVTVQQELILEVPIISQENVNIQPALTAETPVVYDAGKVEVNYGLIDPNEMPLAESDDEIFDFDPLKLKLNVEGFLETLPKENLEKIEDNIVKIKNMIQFLQQIFVSTFNVAGLHLDNNHLMDTGRKRKTDNATFAGIFAKRIFGLTSALNCLEANLITSIECLEQFIHLQTFLPEAQNEPNFMELFGQMDPKCASDYYQQFLSTADSQINFTKKLHKLLQDYANMNTQM